MLSFVSDARVGRSPVANVNWPCVCVLTSHVRNVHAACSRAAPLLKSIQLSGPAMLECVVAAAGSSCVP